MSAAAVAKKNEGNQFFKKKDYDRAIRLYGAAVQLDPTYVVGYSNRAAAYTAKAMWVEAERDGLKCIELDSAFIKG